MQTATSDHLESVQLGIQSMADPRSSDETALSWPPPIARADLCVLGVAAACGAPHQHHAIRKHVQLVAKLGNTADACVDQAVDSGTCGSITAAFIKYTVAISRRWAYD